MSLQFCITNNFQESVLLTSSLGHGHGKEREEGDIHIEELLPLRFRDELPYTYPYTKRQSVTSTLDYDEETHAPFRAQ